MEVDVVVVAYRSAGHLRRCVEPLAGQRDMNVVVVDNACPQQSTRTVSDLPVEIVSMGRNAGFAAGCNAGVHRGRAGAVLLLNPDAAITPANVRRLAGYLEQDPRCAAVGPRLLLPSGETELSMFREPRLRSSLGEAFFLHHFFPRAEWPTEWVRRGYEGSAEPEALIGAVLLVRRSSFEEIGGFDERFFLYCEDTDLSRRLRERGFTLRYEPAASAEHECGGSTPQAGQAALRAEARVLYARLHSRGARYAGFRLACAAHEILRVPIAAARSPRDLRARLAAARVALGGSASRPAGSDEHHAPVTVSLAPRREP